jgi:1,4-alpha-glucan branching enzyme
MVDCHNNYNSVIYDPNAFNWAGDNFTAPALSDTVVYELHIGSFYSPNGANNGTFSNAVVKLDQIKQLGVSAVELMPIAEFANPPSWGYNPTDPFAPAYCAYGGADGLKYFVQACHQRGLAVLLDVVHNHWGPSNLDLWDFDCWDGGGNGGGIYFYQQNGVCCTPWGSRPNYSRPQVVTYIQDSFKGWLDEYHVDGFRWDAPNYMLYYSNNIFIPEAQTMIQQINSMIKGQYSGKINIAENSGWVSGFDSQWAYDFTGNLTPVLTATDDTQRNMSTVASEVNGSGWTRVVYMESHDTAGDLNGGQRLPTAISPATPTDYWARKRSTLGAALTMTSVGIPMVLQGEEMLTTQQFGASNPLDWTRANTYGGILWLYKDLIRLRRNLDGLSSGLEGVNTTVTVTDNSSKLIAYRRWNTGAVGDDVVVVANFANATRTDYNIPFPKTGAWYAQFNSDSTNYSSDFGGVGSTVVTAGATAPVTIAPYSVLIFSQVASPPAPSAPTNLTAAAVGTSQINLTWSPSSGAVFYALKRGGTPICTTTSTSFSDTGLAIGTAYCYTVASVIGGVVSADSPSACVSTPGPNRWLNSGGGKWETAVNWSAGTPALAGQWALLITNANTKTVLIDTATTNIPASLTVSNLTVSAPAGSSNLLWLTNAGTTMPLQVLGTLTIGSGGAVLLTGSSLVATQAVISGLVQVDASPLSFSGPLTNNGTIRLFNGGLLEAWDVVVNNGLIDIINGGGTNFHNAFINNGTVLDASSVRVSNVSLSGDDLVLSIPSVVGHTYQLEMSLSAAPASWSDTGPTQAGTGGALSFTDPGAVTNNLTSFYRIKVTAP